MLLWGDWKREEYKKEKKISLNKLSHPNDAIKRIAAVNQKLADRKKKKKTVYEFSLHFNDALKKSVAPVLLCKPDFGKVPSFR